MSGMQVKWAMMRIYDVGAQLTLKSIWDEFNREHDGSATGYGLWIQIDLRDRVKRGRRGHRQGEGE